jgi:hypothetical protein
MRATQELLVKLESTEGLNYMYVLELRVSVLEYMNHLMNTYLLQGHDEEHIHECVSKLQESYSVLQQISNNRNSDMSDTAFIESLKQQIRDSLHQVQAILLRENA